MIDAAEEAIRLGRSAKALRNSELFEPLIAEVRSRIIHEWEQSTGGDYSFHAELKGLARFMTRLKIIEEAGDIEQRKVDNTAVVARKK